MSPGLKTQFILLAAGNSTRMHRDKALLEIEHKPWLQWQVEKIFGSNVIESVILVEKPEKKEIYSKILNSYSIEVVENSDPRSQPMDSILLALRNRTFPNGVFISPVDVPMNSQSLEKLWQKAIEGFLAVKPSTRGKGGHPIWLHSDLVQKFLAMPQRLDEFLAQVPADQIGYQEIDDPYFQMNLNTPEEWKNFLNLTKAHLKS